MKFKKYYFNSVSSTNDKAISIIKKTKNKYGIINANNQKAGRGQYGKNWISCKGNLFISIFICLDKIKISIDFLREVSKLALDILMTSEEISSCSTVILLAFNSGI